MAKKAQATQETTVTETTTTQAADAGFDSKSFITDAPAPAEGEDKPGAEAATETKVDEGTPVGDEAQPEGTDDVDSWVDWEDDEADDVGEAADEPAGGEGDAAEAEADKGTKGAEAWEVAAEELGIEADSIEEFVAKSKQAIKKLKEIEPQFEEMRVKSLNSTEPVKRLQTLIKLSDEDLVKQNLRAKGFNDEELEEAFNEIDDAGDVEREARNIRFDIKAAIKDQIVNADKYKADEDAKQLQEQHQFFGEVKEALSKTDTFLGLKVGKDDAESEKIKSKAFEDYTSGRLFKDITSSAENMAKLAMLWKLKDNIEGRLVSKGKNQERRRIVHEQLGNAQNFDRTSYPRQGEDDGKFDASKFLQGFGAK